MRHLLESSVPPFTWAAFFHQIFLEPGQMQALAVERECVLTCHTVEPSSPMLKPFWHYTAERLAPRQSWYDTQKRKTENRFPPLRQAEKLQPYMEGAQWEAFYYTCTLQHETKKVGLPISHPIMHSASSCGVFFLPPQWLRGFNKTIHCHTPCL